MSPSLGTLTDLVCIGFFALFVLINFTGIIYVNRFHMAVLVFLAWCTMCVALSSFSSLPYFVLRILFPAFEVLVVINSSVRKNGFHGIKPLYYVCCIYIFLNFVSMLLFPGGMFQSAEGSSIARAQWVLGSKNNIPIYEVIFATIIMAFEAIKKNAAPKKRNYSLLFVLMAIYGVLFSGEHYTGFFEGSSTGIMAIVACSMTFLYISKFESLPRIFTVFNTIIGAAVANGFLLGGMTSPFVTMIITEVFQKNITFSGRTTIWQTNLMQVPGSPIFGYGMNTFDAPVYTAGVLTTTTYTYNMFLKYMISYGVVSIILLVIALLCIKHGDTTVIQLLNAGFIGIIIIGTMNEVSLANLLFFPIIMSALSKEADSAENRIRKRHRRGKNQPEVQT